MSPLQPSSPHAYCCRERSPNWAAPRAWWLAWLLWLVCAAGACSLDTQAESKRTSAVGDDREGWVPSPAPAAPSGRDAAASRAADAAAPDADAAAAHPVKTESPPRSMNNRPDDRDSGEKPSQAPMTGDAVDAGVCASGRPAREETCNMQDDDCDDRIDEACQCTEAERVACYDGPKETRDIGSCRAGRLSCQDGKLGACVEAVLPSPELCNGIDDDCDGVVDDGYALDEDDDNCGRCGAACDDGETCCGGRCVDVQGTDPEHCGACGAACTLGGSPGCCAGECVDLLSDQTCGSCGNACGLLKLGGGFLCSCMLSPMGPACMGGPVRDELMICR